MLCAACTEWTRRHVLGATAPLRGVVGRELLRPSPRTVGARGTQSAPLSGNELLARGSSRTTRGNQEQGSQRPRRERRTGLRLTGRSRRRREHGGGSPVLSEFFTAEGRDSAPEFPEGRLVDWSIHRFSANVTPGIHPHLQRIATKGHPHARFGRALSVPHGFRIPEPPGKVKPATTSTDSSPAYHRPLGTTLRQALPRAGALPRASRSEATRRTVLPMRPGREAFHGPLGTGTPGADAASGGGRGRRRVRGRCGRGPPRG